MPKPATNAQHHQDRDAPRDEERGGEHPEDDGLQPEAVQQVGPPVPRPVAEAGHRAAEREGRQRGAAEPPVPVLAAEGDHRHFGAGEHNSHRRGVEPQRGHAPRAQRRGRGFGVRRVRRRFGDPVGGQPHRTAEHQRATQVEHELGLQLRCDQRRDQRTEHEDDLVQRRLDGVGGGQLRPSGEPVGPPRAHQRPDRQVGEARDDRQRDGHPVGPVQLETRGEREHRGEVHRRCRHQQPPLPDPVGEPGERRVADAVRDDVDAAQHAGEAVVAGTRGHDQHQADRVDRDRRAHHERGGREPRRARHAEERTVWGEHPAQNPSRSSFFGVALPVRLHGDVQVEVDAAAEQLLDPGRAWVPICLSRAPLRADDDALLARPFEMDRREDLQQLRPPLAGA